MNEIYAFTLISLLLVISPGPNGVLIVKTVSGSGKAAGFQNIAGLVAATFCHGAFSILGFSALILQSAELFFVVKMVGAAYLCYLGVKTILGSFKKNSTPKDDVELVRFEKLRGASAFRNLTEGFVTQLLNPKVSMFYLAAFPQFIDFQSSSYLSAFILVSIHAAIILFWFVGVTVFLSRVKRIASNSTVGQWVQRVSGSVLMFFSALMLTQEASK